MFVLDVLGGTAGITDVGAAGIVTLIGGLPPGFRYFDKFFLHLYAYCGNFLSVLC